MKYKYTTKSVEGEHNAYIRTFQTAHIRTTRIKIDERAPNLQFSSAVDNICMWIGELLAHIHEVWHTLTDHWSFT